MTWTKLSDDFSDDCWTLSAAAFRLHVEGLCWSNRKLLDLAIPKDDLRRFAKDTAAVTELLDVGWWSDTGRTYRINHHAQYQRLRDDVVKQQAANARNGAKGGRPRKPGREQVRDLRKPETQSVSEPLGERDGTGQDWSGREEEEELLMNLHEERYSGSDADPMSAPYLSRLDEEDEDWERTWGPRDQAS